MFPSVQSERDDARIGDARRFVSEVERLAVRALGGGRPPRLDQIAGPDRTGTAFAVVDAVGRFVDVDLRPGWWAALGPAGVAPGLLEALATARLKAALVPIILRRINHAQSAIDVIGQHTPSDVGGGPVRGRDGSRRAAAGEPTGGPSRAGTPVSGDGSMLEAAREGVGPGGDGFPPGSAQWWVSPGGDRFSPAAAEWPADPGGDDFSLEAVRGRIDAARRGLDGGEWSAARVITGSRGLFRLHVRGGRPERAETVAGLAADDTERLVADAREALGARVPGPRPRLWPGGSTMS